MLTQVTSYLLMFHPSVKTDSWYRTRCLGQDKVCISFVDIEVIYELILKHNEELKLKIFKINTQFVMETDNRISSNRSL